MSLSSLPLSLESDATHFFYLQGYNPYAGIDKQTKEVLKFQDSAHIKLALRVRLPND